MTLSHDEGKTPLAAKNAVVRNNRREPVSGEIRIQHGKSPEKTRAEFGLDSPIGSEGGCHTTARVACSLLSYTAQYRVWT